MLVSNSLSSLKPSAGGQQTEVTLCSVGSGGCFHELEIHSHLQEYKVTWILIDTYYPSDARFRKGAEHFEVLAKFINHTTKVEIFNKTEDYFNKPEAKPDIILSVDTDLTDGYLQGLKDQVLARGHKCSLAVLNKTEASLKVERA